MELNSPHQSWYQEIKLTNILQVLRNNLKLISQITGFITSIAIIYCIFATPIFTANIIISPPHISDSTGDMTGVFGTTSILSGNVFGMNLMRMDTEIAKTMLGTRFVQDQLIKKYNLIKYYDVENITKARKKLKRVTKFYSPVQTGLLTIAVSDKSPEMAKNLANWYAVALGRLISNVGYGYVSQKRHFFYDQLLIARENMIKAQTNLSTFAVKNGITVGSQNNIMVGISTQLQTELVMLHGQLKELKNFVTEKNPDYQRLQERIYSVEEQINKVSGADLESGGINGIAIPPNLAPELGHKYINLVRDKTLFEDIYGILLKQYEASKIEEMSDQKPSFVQIIDSAEVPLYKSKPKYLWVILFNFVGSLWGSVIYVLLKNRKKLIN